MSVKIRSVSLVEKIRRLGKCLKFGNILFLLGQERLVITKKTSYRYITIIGVKNFCLDNFTIITCSINLKCVYHPHLFCFVTAIPLFMFSTSLITLRPLPLSISNLFTIHLLLYLSVFVSASYPPPPPFSLPFYLSPPSPPPASHYHLYPLSPFLSSCKENILLKVIDKNRNECLRFCSFSIKRPSVGKTMEYTYHLVQKYLEHFSVSHFAFTLTMKVLFNFLIFT